MPSHYSADPIPDWAADEVLPMWNPRRTREVSVELECAYGAELLYGFFERNDIPCVFHEDCTCDGEVILSRFRLSREGQAATFARALAIASALRNDEQCGVSLSTGTHIHVSAVAENGERLSPASLVTLQAGFAHIEDLLFSLASVGWSRHRCEGGDGYARIVPKLDNKNPVTLWRAMGGDRYYGLNISQYIYAMQGCRCGAYIMGDWTHCTCSDNRAAIEWRLWNGSLNPRKIRTFIAISHGLTEWSHRHPEPSASRIPAREYHGRNDITVSRLQAQLEWLLDRPGVWTRVDRSDIRWLASQIPGFNPTRRGK